MKVARSVFNIGKYILKKEVRRNGNSRIQR